MVISVSSFAATGQSKGAEAAGPPVAPPAAKAEATFDITEFRRSRDEGAAADRDREGACTRSSVRIAPSRPWKQAADALEKAYKDAGYSAVFVDIPEQQVADGLVRLKVTEGKLESVHVRGERYYSRRQILAALPALEQGQLTVVSGASEGADGIERAGPRSGGDSGAQGGLGARLRRTSTSM